MPLPMVVASVKFGTPCARMQRALATICCSCSPVYRAGRPRATGLRLRARGLGGKECGGSSLGPDGSEVESAPRRRVGEVRDAVRTHAVRVLNGLRIGVRDALVVLGGRPGRGDRQRAAHGRERDPEPVGTRLQTALIRVVHIDQRDQRIRGKRMARRTRREVQTFTGVVRVAPPGASCSSSPILSPLASERDGGLPGSLRVRRATSLADAVAAHTCRHTAATAASERRACVG